MSTESESGQGAGQQQDDGQALAVRVDGIEKEQKEQRGVLDQILSHVQGGGGPGSGGAAAGTGGGEAQVTYSDFAGKVQEQISAAEERRRKEEGEREQGAWRDGVTAELERLKAENAPREPVTGVRGALQRALLGRD